MCLWNGCCARPGCAGPGNLYSMENPACVISPLIRLHLYDARNIALYSSLSTNVAKPVPDLLPTRSEYQRRLVIRLAGHGAVAPVSLFSSVFKTSPSATSAVLLLISRSVEALELGLSTLPILASNVTIKRMKSTWYCLLRAHHRSLRRCRLCHHRRSKMDPREGDYQIFPLKVLRSRGH